MLGRRFLLTLIACFCFLPECMGQNASSLNGNWLLTGGWDNPPKNGPRLTLTIGAAGEDLVAEGDYQVNGCGAGFHVKGKLAADGAFTLTSAEVSTAAPHVSITGMFDRSSSTWSGFYKTSIGDNCHDSSGKFVAQRIESPHGSYAGTLKTANGGIVSVRLGLITGVFTSQTLRRNAEANKSLTTDEVRFTPLIGTLNIVGLGDISNAEFTAIEDVNNRVKGDEFQISFPVGNGSTLMVSGMIKDGEASAAHVMVANFGEGNGSIAATGFLARQ
jgi:hypothetical protein